jgi:hypothetical protein
MEEKPMSVDPKTLNAAILSGCEAVAKRAAVYAGHPDGMNNDDWERALVSEYLTGSAQALEWLCRTDGLTTPGNLGQAVARVAAHLGLNRAQ